MWEHLDHHRFKTAISCDYWFFRVKSRCSKFIGFKLSFCNSVLNSSSVKLCMHSMLRGSMSFAWAGLHEKKSDKQLICMRLNDIVAIAVIRQSIEVAKCSSQLLCKWQGGSIIMMSLFIPLALQVEEGKRLERADDDELDAIPVVRPDGDVELRDAGKGFLIPPCDQCGGVLKPNVVFFGDGIPKPRAEMWDLLSRCHA